MVQKGVTSVKLAMEKLEHFLELGGTKKRYHTARDLRHCADRVGLHRRRLHRG